jgi:hypothetical protein
MVHQRRIKEVRTGVTENLATFFDAKGEASMSDLGTEKSGFSILSAGKIAVVIALTVLFSGCSMYQTRDWSGTRSYFGKAVDREYALWLEVREDISAPQGQPPQDEKARIRLVKRLCRKAYQLPTDTTAGREWRTPEETERQGGVCLDKSIWLMDAMHKEGIRNVRLVVGVHHGQWRPHGHAWLVWNSGSKRLLLDPNEGDGFVCGLGWMTSQYEPEKSFQGPKMWTHVQQPDTVLQAISRARGDG